MVGTKKALLPIHAGEARYQAALDRDRKFREMVLGAYLLALLCGEGFGQVIFPAGPVGSTLLFFLAAGFALRSSAPRSTRAKLQPALIVTTLSGFAWAFWTAQSLLVSPWDLVLALIGSAAIGFLQYSLSARSLFAPIVVGLVIIHLSGFANPAQGHSKTIVPQMIVLVLEFCLVGMAGYRHAIASLSRYPHSTYRSSPQCLVPSLDHAWDHPLKIDAV